MASFLGYSKEDLEDVIPCGSKNCETEIKKFLTKFQMPYCGTRTIPILHKLADLSGVAEVRMKPIRKGVSLISDYNSFYKGCILLPWSPGKRPWVLEIHGLKNGGRWLRGETIYTCTHEPSKMGAYSRDFGNCCI